MIVMKVAVSGKGGVWFQNNRAGMAHPRVITQLKGATLLLHRVNAAVAERSGGVRLVK